MDLGVKTFNPDIFTPAALAKTSTRFLSSPLSHSEITHSFQGEFFRTSILPNRMRVERKIWIVDWMTNLLATSITGAMSHCTCCFCLWFTILAMVFLTLFPWHMFSKYLIICIRTVAFLQPAVEKLIDDHTLTKLLFLMARQKNSFLPT